jgi:hypothetical protein
MRNAIALLLLLCASCIGPSSVKNPVYYRFEAKEGAEIMVDAPGGFRINAKGPVSIETNGAEMFVTEPEEPSSEPR